MTDDKKRVPVFPSIPRIPKQEPKQPIAKCGECGRDVYAQEMYYCPLPQCPIESRTRM